MKNILSIGIAIIVGYILWKVFTFLFSMLFFVTNILFMACFIAVIGVPIYFAVRSKLLK
jgi:hypothetical protein